MTKGEMMPDTTYQQRVFDRATFRETVGEIQSVVAAEFGVSVDAMLSASHAPEFSLPRQIGMHLTHVMTAAKLLKIGRQFGRRDHTTVIHALNRVSTLMADNDAFRERVEGLRIRLSGDVVVCPVYAVGHSVREVEAV